MCTWNSHKPHFTKVLESVRREVPIHCFILIDKFSKDDTIQVVCEYFPQAKIFRTMSELARARQIGIEQVDTEHFVFVDDDIVLPSGWFHRLWENVDSKTGAIHAHAIPALPFPYEKKWREWQGTWGLRRGVEKKAIIEVTKENMDETLGYTHNTIIRTSVCEDWNPPTWLTAFEDQLLLRHIVEKGYKWKILSETYVQHYSCKNLSEHLRKSKWRTAAAQVTGLLKCPARQLITDLIKRTLKSLRASIEVKDPRVLAYVVLYQVAFLDGYLRWNRYLHLNRE